MKAAAGKSSRLRRARSHDRARSTMVRPRPRLIRLPPRGIASVPSLTRGQSASTMICALVSASALAPADCAESLAMNACLPMSSPTDLRNALSLRMSFEASRRATRDGAARYLAWTPIRLTGFACCRPGIFCHQRASESTSPRGKRRARTSPREAAPVRRPLQSRARAVSGRSAIPCLQCRTCGCLRRSTPHRSPGWQISRSCSHRRRSANISQGAPGSGKSADTRSAHRGWA